MPLQQHSRNLLSSRIEALLAEAPEAVRPSLRRLLDAAGGDVRDMLPENRPPQDWQELLDALTRSCAPCGPADDRLRRHYNQLKQQHYESLLMIEIMYELINVGQDFATADEVLEESAQILRRELDSDLFVCRLRRADGTWENVAADSADNFSTPIFVRYMEEGLPFHPVMRAVQEPEAERMFVLSNDLRAAEMGGESLDCTPYKEGYRSRLSFILRDADHKAFGLIMLYDHREGYFRRYDEGFLGDCAKIVSLTVERRLEMGQDALSKAFGGMAHVGNNALSVIKHTLELVVEELEEFSKAFGLGLPEAQAPEHDPAVRALLDSLRAPRKIEAIHRALHHVDRLRGAIERLGQAVHTPVIMPYIQGEEVLDLEPTDMRRELRQDWRSQTS